MATKIMFNGEEFKSATAVKNYVRKSAFDMLRNYFADRFGADNVSVVDSNTVCVCTGTVVDEDGFEHEVCFTVKPTAKDFFDRVSPSTNKPIPAFDRLDAQEEYSVVQKEKEEKELEKKKKKEEKIAKDKAEKEKKKAEKEKAKAQEENTSEEETVEEQEENTGEE